MAAGIEHRDGERLEFGDAARGERGIDDRRRLGERQRAARRCTA
jgi:hypothetical protein